MSQQLKNKNIVIVGGTTGIGLSAAKAFIAEGAKVVVVGRNADSVAEAKKILGKDAEALAADATHPETANNSILTCIEEFGSFDGLYHVAGGSGRKFGDGPLHELTDEGIAQTLDLNLKSVLYSNRAALQQFLKQDSGGAILNMASVLGYSPSPKFFATHVYAAAKAAIIGVTKAAASYYAAKNIRLNVIAPA